MSLHPPRKKTNKPEFVWNGMKVNPLLARRPRILRLEVTKHGQR